MNPSTSTPAPPSDTEILDWLIFYAGRVVVHESAETVTVEWYSSDGEAMNTPILDCDPRAAVKKAMKINDR